MKYQDCNQIESTQVDSSQEKDQEIYYHQIKTQKHKTQLCKKYTQFGFCNYGLKCKFAHGKQELNLINTNQYFRKKKCHGYWFKGVCLYGIRCQFAHNAHQRSLPQLLVASALYASQNGKSKLLTLIYQ